MEGIFSKLIYSLVLKLVFSYNKPDLKIVGITELKKWGQNNSKANKLFTSLISHGKFPFHLVGITISGKRILQAYFKS